MPEFFRKTGHSKWLLWVLYSLCALLLVLDFILPRHHYLQIEKLPIFYPLFGFIAPLVLILVVSMLRRLLRRNEDYYDS